MDDNRLRAELSRDPDRPGDGLHDEPIVRVVTKFPARERRVRLIEPNPSILCLFAQGLCEILRITGVPRAIRIGHREHGKIDRVISGARENLHTLRFTKGTEHNVCLCR